jgi:hypothetical protein
MGFSTIGGATASTTTGIITVASPAPSFSLATTATTPVADTALATNVTGKRFRVTYEFAVISQTGQSYAMAPNVGVLWDSGTNATVAIQISAYGVAGSPTAANRFFSTFGPSLNASSTSNYLASTLNTTFLAPIEVVVDLTFTATTTCNVTPMYALNSNASIGRRRMFIQILG